MPSTSHDQACLDSNRFGDGFDCCCEPDWKSLCAQRDEEFAQFVFAHFGGYGNVPTIPQRIAARVVKISEEFKSKMGVPGASD